MNRIKILQIINGSLKAKVIAGVAAAVVTGGVATGVYAYNNHAKAVDEEKARIEMTEKVESENKETRNFSTVGETTNIEDITTGKTEEEVKKEETQKVAEKAKADALKEGKTEEEANEVANKAATQAEEQYKVQETEKSSAPTSQPTQSAEEQKVSEPAPAPQPAPAPKPEQNYEQTITVPGPFRNVYGGIYTEYGSVGREVSGKNSITYGGQWVGKMDETLRKFSAGKFNGQDCKNIWLGKYIDGKYKVVNVRTTTAVISWTADNVLPQFEAKGIWSLGPSSGIHFDKTLVYGSNIPDFRASRLVIDLQPIN